MEPDHFLSEARALSKLKKNELQGKQTLKKKKQFTKTQHQFHLKNFDMPFNLL